MKLRNRGVYYHLHRMEEVGLDRLGQKLVVKFSKPHTIFG